MQCLPPGDPRILCSKHGSPISGKSFIFDQLENFTGHFVHIEQFDIFSLFTRNLEWLGVYGNGGSVSTKHRISRSFNQSEIRSLPCNGCVNVALHRRLNLRVILLVNSAFYCVIAYDASGYQQLCVASVVK